MGLFYTEREETKEELSIDEAILERLEYIDKDVAKIRTYVSFFFWIAVLPFVFWLIILLVGVSLTA